MDEGMKRERDGKREGGGEGESLYEYVTSFIIHLCVNFCL